MFDDLAKLCLVLMFVPVVAYMAIIYGQFINLQKKTYRLTVLCVRTAMFLPLYAILMYVSTIMPSSYEINTVIITVVEGYSFYCFFALITTNLGGPAATVDLMYKTQKDLFCNLCCPSDCAVFYTKVTWAIFHLFITRSVLSVISTIVFYSGNEVGKLVFVGINVVSAIILFYGVISLVNLYENLFDHCINLFGIIKLLLLKVSVGIITIQGLIESFVFSSGASPYKGDDEYSAEDKTLRAYSYILILYLYRHSNTGAIVLAEFVVLSFVYYYAFGYKVITASTASHKTPSTENAEAADYRFSIGSDSAKNSTGIIISTPTKFSFCTFVGDVLRLQDIMGVITYRSELYTPLGMDEA